jgi:hypothetical protein
MTFHKPLKAATRTTPLSTSRATALSAILCIALFSACRPPGKPVTDTEALDFAKTIENSVSQQNPDVLDNAIDRKYFAGLVLRQAGQRFNFTLAQKAQTAVAAVHMGRDVVKVTGQNGSYDLVRRYEKDGHQHLLFRLVAPNLDIDYNDIELIRGDQGVRVVDVYNYGDGEQLSKAVTGKLLEAEKTAPLSDTDRENASLVARAEQFLHGGNPDEAYSFYIQITDKAKKEQPIQRLHVRIAVKMGDSVYKAALKEYQSNFPQDPFIYLAIFKNDARIQDFPGSLEALDRFERFLPADPFLDFFRAFLYKQINNPLQSRLALERLNTWNPLNTNVIVELVDNHVKAGHPDSAAILILEAEQRKIITPEQVDTVKKVYPALRSYLK